MTLQSTLLPFFEDLHVYRREQVLATVARFGEDCTRAGLRRGIASPESLLDAEMRALVDLCRLEGVNLSEHELLRHPFTPVRAAFLAGANRVEPTRRRRMSG